jgi:hypothetical protein
MDFDDYAHVPACKSMTQRKRSAKVVTYEYDPAEALPRVPPEDWNAAMRNRNFKINVIKFVVSVPAGDACDGRSSHTRACIVETQRYSSCRLRLPSMLRLFAGVRCVMSRSR